MRLRFSGRTNGMVVPRRREACGGIDFQFGHLASLAHVTISMRRQLRGMVKRHGIGALDLAPDWRLQISRARAPCRGASDFDWHRTGLVGSLGELMEALGK